MSKKAPVVKRRKVHPLPILAVIVALAALALLLIPRLTGGDAGEGHPPAKRYSLPRGRT